MAVVYPDLGGEASRSSTLSGTSDQIARALAGYAALGVAQVMVEFFPYTDAAFDRFADAVARFRTLG